MAVTRNRARSLSSDSKPRRRSNRLQDGDANPRGILPVEEEQELELNDAEKSQDEVTQFIADDDVDEDAGGEVDYKDDDFDGKASLSGAVEGDREEYGEDMKLAGHRTADDAENGKVQSRGRLMEERGELDSKETSITIDAVLRTTSMQHTKANRNTNKTKSESMGNALTKLIPGYTAPRMLNTSSLDKFRPKGGIRELQRRAERTDASTKDFVVGSTAIHTNAMRKTAQGFLPQSYTDAYSSFKKGVKRDPDNTAGKGWFGMIPTPMTDELKTDLAVIRNRSYLDPKRFYKSADKHHKIVQVGTVIEGPSEYFSSRLTKKQRRSNITEEIMADPSAADYAKNKFKQMSREQTHKAQMRKVKTKRVKKFY